MSDQSEVEMLRARVSQLEAALNQKSKRMASAFNLTPSLSDLLGLLLSLPHVNSEVVQDQMGTFTSIKVAMCRLRKILAPHGVEIKSQRFGGYWLTEKDKIYIRSLLTEEVSAAA